jgi:hypothetical protein
MTQQNSNYTQRPPFNPEPMVNKLSAMFRQETKALAWNSPTLKQLQTTFMYLIDEIQRGPVYDASKMSVFVLHWVQKIGPAIKGTGDELEKLIDTTYTHQNFFVQ